ncbi:ThiF family adenylyltransferase [Glaciecola sp. MF2-115]|uniref:ThiF family adenylyltransferase n=1 Tax=Glaciecola sp. MF2-115 TaxID=3384827 RepID=UPI0039A1F3FF
MDMHEYSNLIDTLLSPYNTRRLSTLELKNYQNYSFGWHVTEKLLSTNKTVTIALLCKESFLYDIPSVYLLEPKLAPLSYPHIEKDGKLCVWPSSFIVDNSNEFILELLNDAFLLLDKIFNDGLEEDFRNEFLSYWFYHCSSALNYTSICRPDNRTTRQITTYKNKKLGIIFGDNESQLTEYLDNRKYLQKSGKIRKRQIGSFQTSALICFTRAWLPDEYPKKVSDFFKLIIQEFGDGSDEVLAMVCTALSNRYSQAPSVLVSFETENGVCFSSLEFKKGFLHRERFNNRSVQNGFRNKIPAQHIVDHFSNVRLTGGSVKRNDLSWILGRDVNHSWQTLQSHSVTIIGCGSVGAPVSKLLIQSGVQELLLFDDDIFKSENTSRHLLGLNYEGVSKAYALADYLTNNFPHVKIHFFEERFQDAVKDKDCMNKLENSDLILSCTAEWKTEQELLDLQSAFTLGPIVFSYVEAHAMAGHVVVNPADSNAFNSLHFTKGQNVGKMKCSVTSWEHPTTVRIPACAGEFQPYGIVPLTRLHALLSEVVLDLLHEKNDSDIVATHSVWIESKKRLVEQAGSWSKEWIETYGELGAGNILRKYVLNDNKWLIKND